MDEEDKQLVEEAKRALHCDSYEGVHTAKNILERISAKLWLRRNGMKQPVVQNKSTIGYIDYPHE